MKRLALLLLLLLLAPGEAGAQLFPRRDGPLLSLRLQIGRPLPPRLAPLPWPPLYEPRWPVATPRILFSPRVAWEPVIVPGPVWPQAYRPQFNFSGRFGGYYP